MANPNIVAVTTINGRSLGISVNNTNTVLVSNPASSGKVLKLNTLILTNTIGDPVPILLTFHPNGANATGASNVLILDYVTIPSGAAIVAIDKSTSIYLTENMSVSAQANNSGTVNATISYEEIS